MAEQDMTHVRFIGELRIPPDKVGTLIAHLLPFLQGVGGIAVDVQYDFSDQPAEPTDLEPQEPPVLPELAETTAGLTLEPGLSLYTALADVNFLEGIAERQTQLTILDSLSHLGIASIGELWLAGRGRIEAGVYKVGKKIHEDIERRLGEYGLHWGDEAVVSAAAVAEYYSELSQVSSLVLGKGYHLQGLSVQGILTLKEDGIFSRVKDLRAPTRERRVRDILQAARQFADEFSRARETRQA